MPKAFRRLASAALTGGLIAAALPADAAPARPAAKAAAARIAARVAQVPTGAQRPTAEVLLSVGQGELVNLPVPIANIWTSNPSVADVYVSNPRQIHLFGKEAGEATVFATTAGGGVVYATNVRVSQNLTSIDRVLKVAMPEAQITVTPVGQVVVLSGTVGSPEDVEEAERLVKSLLNPGVDVTAPNAVLKIGTVNRLRTATPLQVNLQVRIAEVSRDLTKSFGLNLLTRDTTGGFLFGIAQGRSFGSITTDAATGATNFNLNGLGQGAGITNLGLAGRLFGLDVATALDLAEGEGLITTLANPNLTALSGETASFLAGGEIPIPLAQGLGQIGVEFKQYGVSLSFTPTVLSDGRISMRVRPEVSELTSAGAVTIGGFQIPALTTRRAETTVELGSGQSFMIGGLLQNRHTNNVDRAPGLGDLPILGALFRSTRFRRAETELMIIVTPYLVKPSSTPLPLPTDGYRSATDAERVLLGQTAGSGDTSERPVPRLAPPVSGGATAPVPGRAGKTGKDAGDPAPGFSN
ncbi:secretion system protein [Sphingomonas changnyeongensis]|uniref:Secretion system protein n=2 Tax=Sphingomonas changnyeongensis TaxID=2698679 RepID=A0A7Z2S6S2_9SPHN|nr:type II and III secretion system protein family protein [Sphingomonas changnyeongensis]QHL91813.1 secretion system protein [Sphingomonas changnyeongensis]